MISRLRTLFLDLLPSKTNKLMNFIFIGSLLSFFLYSFSIPTFSTRYPFNYVSILLCAVMCIFMCAYVFLYGKFKVNIYIVIIVIFNIFTLITHLINFNFESFPKTIILMSIVSFFIYEFASNIKNKDIIPVCILISGVVFAVIYIFHYRTQLLHINLSIENRLGSFFDNENEISKEFGFFCLISFSIFLINKKFVIKITGLVLAVLFLFLILSTGSISNLLTVLISCLLISIIAQKSIKKKIIIGAVSLAAVALFFAFVQLPFMGYFKNRLDNIISTLFNKGKDGIDGSASSRLQAAFSALKVGLYRPIFGYGYMSGTKFTMFNIQAHNNFVELFVDFGLCGFICYESFIILSFIYGRKTKSKVYIIALMLYMLIFQFFLTTYYKKFEYVILAYAFAAIDDVFDYKFVIYDSKCLRRKNQKNVIFEIIPSFKVIGGAETFFASFVKSANKQYGDLVQIIAIVLYKQDENNVLVKQISDSGVKIIQLDKRKGFDLKCSLKLRELIFEYGPSVIHTHLYSILTLKTALPFRRKKKIFHTIHHSVGSNDFNQKLLTRLVKQNYLTPICVANNPAIGYKELFNKEVVYINNGVDLTRFDNRKLLYKRENDFLIVGRFVEVKNYKWLLEIINEYFKENNYKFVFLGDGPLFDECESIIKNNCLDKCVTLVGRVDNVKDYMANSKILLIPSTTEGNPMVINEAFASGMTVIGNDTGGIHDLLINVSIGGLASINSKDEFAKLMYDTINSINSNKIENLEYNLPDISIDGCVEKYFNLFNIDTNKPFI